MSEVKLNNCYYEEGRSPDVAISAIFFILLSPFSSHATCTPTPDCADLGYTETSCEGDSLKCPFDISKLYCIPCVSSFKYDCTGYNITGSTGDSCGGKYVSCECESGGVFNNGTCPQSCNVGMIYYSDGSCSDEIDSTKTALGIIVKDNELVMSQKLVVMTWGFDGTDISTLTDYSSSADAITDFNGKENTALIVTAHTSAGLTSSESAAMYCNEYAPTGTNAGDWYLPAAGELYDYVYGNYSSKLSATASNLGWNIAWSFWSSSERSNNYAWYVPSSNGYVNRYGKDTNDSVSCFLAIN